LKKCRFGFARGLFILLGIRLSNLKGRYNFQELNRNNVWEVVRSMITNEQLIDGFSLNIRLIKLQTDGLSHGDSLIQTPYNINCMNWVLGHIAVNRDNVMRLIGAEPLLSETETLRYKTESNPITGDDPDVLRLERLLEVLTTGQTRIEAALNALSEADLSEEIQVGERMMPLRTRLHGFYFHDTYHTGQTDLLRRIAGANDKVV